VLGVDHARLVGMSKPLYTAAATVSGGRLHGHGRTSDGELDVVLRPPGEGGGTNPEQLFAVGYAACFESALGTVARRRRVEIGDVAIDSRVSLVAAAERTYTIAVELDVTCRASPTPKWRASSSRPRTASARTPTPRGATSTSRSRPTACRPAEPERGQRGARGPSATMSRPVGRSSPSSSSCQ
jgi:Ohr subfamily peroxiredoxin